ncbi:MAG: hypothetical protein IT249_12235 [Chitinophagaceae bacterium]|nr:hypothetical protein [Chitinophagaceae bacterium]
MKKDTYIFICLLFSLDFWKLSIVNDIVNQDIILVLTLIWSLLGFVFFKKNATNILFTRKYLRFANWMFAGIFISMFSAYFFWQQTFLQSFIAQRFSYAFILLPSLLYVKPAERDIIRALKWVSALTIVVWFLVAVDPSIISIDEEGIANKADTDFGYYIEGIHYVVLYLFFKVQYFINKFSVKTSLEVGLLLAFVFLYQNRSIMLGVFPVIIYALIKFRSSRKFVLISFISMLLIAGIIYTSETWSALFEETQAQLDNPDYGRNLALGYYLFQYSPHWFCYIFGNGFPSGGNSPLGDLMWDNFKLGIYASDLGLIGMWTSYGLIPIIVVYSVIIKTLWRKQYPLYFKFICFHILFVPTIFHFWRNPGVTFFVIIFYLYAYYTEQNEWNAGVNFYNNRKL